jgi:RNA-directed DNA polymerase
MTTQNEPAAVSAGAKQAGDIRARWAWVAAPPWTDRMLQALERGVAGGKWFALIDKVHDLRTLERAARKVIRKGGAAGVDHVTCAAFERRLPEEIGRLSEELRTGRYQPQAVRRVVIPKAGGGTRPLGIPTVRDRVVQAALAAVLAPIFERDFAAQSYGFRPNRGCKDALRRVAQLLVAGYVHVVDADLQSYFDTIPHARLLARVAEKVADGAVLALLEAFLTAGVLDGLREWTPTAGAPQGAVLSPLLSNIYLDALDHLLAARGYEMVRYADDFVILCRHAADALAALERVRQWTADNGLTLHPDKTKTVDERQEGFEFLGYRFERGRRQPRAKSVAKLKEAVRMKTRRTSGRSLAAIVADLNRTLRGWFGFFQHGGGWVYANLDGWIRRRLRTLLRKRTKRRGLAQGLDNHRWPNVFFREQGLFSLQAARTSALQSAWR